MPLLNNDSDSIDLIEHGNESDVDSDEDLSSDGDRNESVDSAVPLDLILFDHVGVNNYVLDFLSQVTIGPIRRSACKRMWDLFRRHHPEFAMHLQSYDTFERRLKSILPQPRVSWKVLNLDTNKCFSGTGSKFPEKFFGDRSKFETLLVWTRMSLRDVIQLHAGTHINCSEFVVDGKIDFKRVHITVTCDGIPNGRGSSLDNLHLTSIRFRGCRLVYVIHARVAKRKEAKDVDDFFASLVEECNKLNINVDYYVADAPMRAFTKRLKGHAGRHSCETCEARGVCVNRKIVYPASMVMQRRRTNERWLECLQDLEEQRTGGYISDVKGVMGRSPLLDLHDFDVVNQAPTDPLHRDWLGIVKGTLWRHTTGMAKSGNLSARGLRITNAVSDHYKSIRLPEEFSHRARQIDYANFKAHEWKSLVMTSFTAICDIVQQEVGHECAHIWVTFVFLVLVYYGPEWLFYEFEQDYLHDLHERMYDEFEMEFGQGACSYNWHAFYHMPIVRRLGRQCHVSTEPFESAYGLAQGSYQSGTRNIGLQLIRNMLVRCAGHTPEYCQNKLHLEPEKKSLRSDNSIALDKMLNYYKVLGVHGQEVRVRAMVTNDWECHHDPTLPFSKVGVVKYTGQLDLVERTYPKEFFMGKGVLLPDGVLVPMYWDLLYS